MSKPTMTITLFENQVSNSQFDFKGKKRPVMFSQSKIRTMIKNAKYTK